MAEFYEHQQLESTIDNGNVKCKRKTSELYKSVIIRMYRTRAKVDTIINTDPN